MSFSFYMPPKYKQPAPSTPPVRIEAPSLPDLLRLGNPGGAVSQAVQTAEQAAATLDNLGVQIEADQLAANVYDRIESEMPKAKEPSEFSKILHSVENGLKKAEHGVENFFEDIFDGAVDLAKDAGNSVENALEKLKEAAEKPFKDIGQILLIGGGIALLVIYLNRESIKSAAGTVAKGAAAGVTAGAKIAL